MQDTSAAIHPENASQHAQNHTGAAIGAITCVIEQDQGLLLIGTYFNLAITSVDAGVIRIMTFRGHQPNGKTTSAIVESSARAAAPLTWKTTDEEVSIAVGKSTITVNRQTGRIHMKGEDMPGVDIVSLQRNREAVGDYMAFVSLTSDDHIDVRLKSRHSLY